LATVAEASELFITLACHFSFTTITIISIFGNGTSPARADSGTFRLTKFPHGSSTELLGFASSDCLLLNGLILAIVAEASELCIALTQHFIFAGLIFGYRTSPELPDLAGFASSRVLLFDRFVKELTVAIRNAPSHLISEAVSYVFALLFQRNSTSGHHTESILPLDGPLDAVRVSTFRACVILSFL